MIPVLALAVVLLAGAGVFLILQKGLFRVILGFSLLAHAANLMVLAAAGEPGAPAILTSAGSNLEVTDPLPQALVLTAIVISMAITLYLLMLLAALGRSRLETTMEPALHDDAGREFSLVLAELSGEEQKK